MKLAYSSRQQTNSMATNIFKKAKAIRRKHPKKYAHSRNPWVQYVKEAAGKKTRKRRVSGIKLVESGESRNSRPKKVYRVVRTRKGQYKSVKRLSGTKRVKRTSSRKPVRSVIKRTVVKYRQVGKRSSMNKLLPMLAIAAVGVGAVYLMTKKSAAQSQLPPIQQTANPVRNDQSAQIVNYAIAGGLAIDAVIKLINSLNTKSDAEVSNLYNNVQQGYGIPGTFYI